MLRTAGSWYPICCHPFFTTNTGISESVCVSLVRLTNSFENLSIILVHTTNAVNDCNFRLHGYEMLLCKCFCCISKRRSISARIYQFSI